MNRRHLLFSLPLLALPMIALPLAVPLPARAAPPTLADMEARVRRDYAVAQLPNDALDAWLKAGNTNVILLDVREPAEYAVSHLPSAVRVDPGVRSRALLATLAPQAAGKTVVLYCSVGVRSSELAEKVQRQLREAGALGVYNLEGGLFAWHNDQADGKPLSALVDTAGQSTPYIHPYDAYWGQLLTGPADLQRY